MNGSKMNEMCILSWSKSISRLCIGGELFDRIVQIGHFGEKQAAILFKQILSSLNYCHKMKICHRDLKPENFLFESKSPDSTINLIDFGLSKIFADSSNSITRPKNYQNDHKGRYTLLHCS